MSVLYKILNRKNKHHAPVATPEWPELDGQLFVRKLPPIERTEFYRLAADEKPAAGVEFLALMTVYCTVIQKGSEYERAFVDRDWRMLSADAGSGSNASGALKLTTSYPFTGSNPAAGDAFVMSNIATANALTVGMNALPNEVAAIVLDMSEAYGGDGTPIATQNGLILGAMITNPAALVAALVTAGVLQLVSGSTTLYQFTAEAVANVPIPTVVNFSASTQIEEEIHHEHS